MLDYVSQCVKCDRLQEYIKYDIHDGIDGAVIIKFTPRYHNCNMYDTCHGGILCTLSDNSMFSACYNYIGRSDITICTKSLTYNFIIPARRDIPIIFEAKITCIARQKDTIIGYSYGEYQCLRNSKL